MFDFDELDEQEADVAEAQGEARKEWEPVPEDIWKKLPSAVREDAPRNFKDWKAVVNDTDVGEYWGIEFPFTPKMLRQMGPKWLTEAMHLAGTLPPENEVTRFLSMDVKAEDVTKEDAENAKWGGAGLKILLKVAYKNGPGDLTEWMFIKMPHEFTGKNERQKNSLNNPMDWFEVTWYNIFGGRFGHLPFRSPRMYFCDMSRKTTNFINVIEMVGRARGENDHAEYFPAPEKYKDWDLPNKGVDFYYAHTRTMAQFFGWHRNIRKKTSQVEDLFMDKGFYGFLAGVMPAIEGAGPYASKERNAMFSGMLTNPGIKGFLDGNVTSAPSATKGFLDMARSLVLEAATQAFPKDLTEKSFIDRVFREAAEMSPYAREMTFYSQCIPEYFSLAHPNAQVDNAWYWKEEDGQLQCGLLDWGGVCHVPIPTCLGNGWMGAEPEVMDEHEDKLIRLFVDEFEKVTGFKYDFEDLRMHIKLAQAAVFFGCCANTGMLFRVIKRQDWATMTGRTDSRIQNNFLMRCYFVQIELFLAMWKKRSPFAMYKEWSKKVTLPPPPPTR